MKTKLIHMAVSYENLSSEFRKLVVNAFCSFSLILNGACR